MASVDNICWDSADKTSTSIGNESIDVIDTSMTNTSFFFPDQSISSDQEREAETRNKVDIDKEINDFLQRIKDKGVSCPIMALREPFSSNFVPKKPEHMIHDLTADDCETDLTVINLYLSSLYEPSYCLLTIDELRDIAESVQLSYTQDQIDFIEEHTREQSSCKLWYRFRTGRITGSTFKSSCRTPIESPSITVIQRICFPERCIFKSKATEYGKRNEPIARDAFYNTMITTHHNFEMKTVGFIINNKYPFCGVSPDAVISCDCCGKGVLEIKCPYVMRFGDFKSYVKPSKSPLIMVNNGETMEYNLKQDHEYYYQVQMQMFLTETDYCDFVVWNPKSYLSIRVYRDEPFRNDKFAEASEFFKKVLLPELFTCHYTRKRALN